MLAPTILLFSFTTLFCYDVLMTQYVLFRSWQDTVCMVQQHTFQDASLC
jgi:hypothetical protein